MTANWLSPNPFGVPAASSEGLAADIRRAAPSLVELTARDDGSVVAKMESGRDAQGLAKVLRGAGFRHVRVREPRGLMRPYYIVNARV